MLVAAPLLSTDWKSTKITSAIADAIEIAIDEQIQLNPNSGFAIRTPCKNEAYTKGPANTGFTEPQCPRSPRNDRVA